MPKHFGKLKYELRINNDKSKFYKTFSKAEKNSYKLGGEIYGWDYNPETKDYKITLIKYDTRDYKIRTTLIKNGVKLE